MSISQSLYYGNQWNNQVVASGSASVVPGLNLGASGVSFTIPTGIPYFQVAASAATVTVSGAGFTINGGASALTVTALTGKSLILNGTDYISF